MIFGFTAITPMEFLLLALRLLNTFKWKGHKLSNWLDDLEKLGETRWRMIVWMYASKKKKSASKMITSLRTFYQKILYWYMML